MMKLVAFLVGLLLGAPLLPAASWAGGRGVPRDSRGGFRTPAAFHDRAGLAGEYRSPGRFHARDSLLNRGAPRPLPPAGFVSGAAVLAGPPAVYATPLEVTVAPVTQVFSTVYVSAAGSAPPSPAAPLAPSGPPMPTVVEYPTGRYELRGDGVTTPHVWVWIPNPPPAPPPASEPPAVESAPARSSQVYRWTDEEGTTFLTNRPEAIPGRHRAGLDRPGTHSPVMP